MSLQITRRDLSRALSAAKSARDALSIHTPTVSNVTHRASEAGLINGAAFLTGLVQGRLGPMLLPGNIPAAAAVGLAGHVAGLFGLAGKYDDQLHSISNGILSGYAHTLGMGFGGRMRTKAGLPAIWGTSLAGALGSGASGPTDAELRAMSRSVR